MSFTSQSSNNDTPRANFAQRNVIFFLYFHPVGRESERVVQRGIYRLVNCSSGRNLAGWFLCARNITEALPCGLMCPKRAVCLHFFFLTLRSDRNIHRQKQKEI